jgi:hypothetical protein
MQKSIPFHTPDAHPTSPLSCKLKFGCVGYRSVVKPVECGDEGRSVFGHDFSNGYPTAQDFLELEDVPFPHGGCATTRSEGTERCNWVSKREVV